MTTKEVQVMREIATDSMLLALNALRNEMQRERAIIRNTPVISVHDAAKERLRKLIVAHADIRMTYVLSAREDGTFVDIPFEEVAP